MMGLTHLGFAYFLLRLFQEAGVLGYQGVLGLGCLFIGALLPDIDSPFSLLGRVVQPLSFEIWEEFGHRSLTHSLFALGHILLIYLLSFNKLVLMVLIGYASHLLIDLLSKSGVRLLFPLDVEFVILGGPIEVGSWQDFALFIAFDILAFIPHYVLFPVRWAGQG